MKTLIHRFLQLSAGALGLCVPLSAAVLPEERADALYHSYEGGGVEISGPSVLVLKQIGQSAAVSGNYYVDSVSSASIDVVTTASPYSEERTETSVAVDYLRGRTTMGLGYTHSSENDYTANTANFSIGQSMFGDITTVTMGYARGWDEVGKRDQADFSEDIARQHYRLGLSQVLTKDAVLDLSYEAITDEGFLNNPYRSVRYLDSGSASGYSFEAERYPRTRTSNAVAARALYYLPYRASVHGEYRFFTDTWGIDAHTAEIGYTHPAKGGWTFDLKYRYYTQGKADFYADLFPRANAQNFLARDKELSTFRSHTVGFGVSYDILRGGWKMFDRGTLNLSYDHIMFDYDDFRDLTVTGVAPGSEPLYSFSADVLQLYLSVWY